MPTSGQPSTPLWVVTMLLFSISAEHAEARQITIKNSCSSTVWPGMHTGGTNPPSQATGWELAAGLSTTFSVDDAWTAGRIWARTGCVNQGGLFQCLTGACGSGANSGGINGDITCTTGDVPPATLAEFTLNAAGQDNFDVSLVDGYNVPMNIIPSISTCPQANCQGNVNALCPAHLRTGIDSTGVNYGCLTACGAGFGDELYGNRDCCTGAYVNSTLCASSGVDYYNLFKDQCKRSYAYAYDEKSGTALWTCAGAPDYTIELCPAGSDYLGVKTPSVKYASDTASVTSAATTWTTTYSVAPSPTSIASAGTLSVAATVAAGAGSAAAVVTSVASGDNSPGALTFTTAIMTSTPSSSSMSSSSSGIGLVAVTGNPTGSITSAVSTTPVTTPSAQGAAFLVDTVVTAAPSGTGKSCKQGSYLKGHGGGSKRSRHAKRNF